MQEPCKPLYCIKLHAAHNLPIALTKARERPVMAYFGNPVNPFRELYGIKVPNFVLPEVVERIKTAELYSDDVWICTYPKSGTTWTQQIVKLIRSKGENDGKTIDRSVPWLEANSNFPDLDLDYLLSESFRPRAFKSHFPYNLFPTRDPPHTTPCKYIYTLRNPKDVSVSLFFHVRTKYYPELDWDTYWDMFVTKGIHWGYYFDHVLSWWPHRHEKNILMLHFEDRKKDLKSAIAKIASFIGVHLTDDIVAKIAETTTFETMKNDNTVNYSWLKFYEKEETPRFCRKGIVGDWKNYLTPEQSAQMDAICATRLKGTGLEFQYE